MPTVTPATFRFQLMALEKATYDVENRLVAITGST